MDDNEKNSDNNESSDGKVAAQKEYLRKKVQNTKRKKKSRIEAKVEKEKNRKKKRRKKPHLRISQNARGRAGIMWFWFTHASQFIGTQLVGV